MPDLVPWDPYNDLHRLREDVGRLFGGLAPWAPWRGRDWGFGAWGPAVDVQETDTHVVVSAEIPGVKPEDLDVTITEDGLTIRGEIKQGEETNARGYRRIERRYGSFQRTIPFPSPVQHEKATADYRNGVLEVRVPKADEAKGRALRLKVNTDQPRALH